MKYHKNVYRALAMITQFGVNMLVPIFVCSFVGMFLDQKLGTSFLMVLFFFIGALAGGRNVYVFARKIFSDKPERDRRGRNRNVKADLESASTTDTDSDLDRDTD